MSHKLVIGIDPGLDGGIAIIRSYKRDVMPMPVIGKKGKDKRELDAKAIVNLLRDNTTSDTLYSGTLCVVEHVHAMPKQGVTSMFNFALGYGTIRGILCALVIPVVYVSPQAWKKVILAGTKKDKCAAISYCQNRFPAVSLVLPGCRTPHDGMADALCLAEYGLTLVKDTNEYVQETDGQ